MTQLVNEDLSLFENQKILNDKNQKYLLIIEIQKNCKMVN